MIAIDSKVVVVGKVKLVAFDLQAYCDGFKSSRCACSIAFFGVLELHV